MLARFLSFIPITLSTNGNKENGNFNSRTRPHLEENLAKSLKDHSKFNRAQATEFSRHSLNNQVHWLQASPLVTQHSPACSFWSCYRNGHHACLPFSRFLLTQSFYSFTALAAHASNHFPKPVYTSHDALLVFSPPRTATGYTSHV